MESIVNHSHGKLDEKKTTVLTENIKVRVIRLWNDSLLQNYMNEFTDNIKLKIEDMK